ncbi:YgfZ/GcvT domain-containing protein [Rhizobium sp. SGZ-381]|uniref:CAF17-like 4Fe-4S cluster assembly/insertion protein YgfZ n=1 Tax=Rhizobium sp. SGZ-381 TaxID=3342800 RepID=UPI0036725955
MTTATLFTRRLIRIEGADAQSFLQGIVTTDIDGLAEGEARPGALLTPQGKILFDFIIWRADGGFLVECDQALSEAFLRRLTMYRLRAAVTLTQEEASVSVTWGEAADSAAGVTDMAFAKAGRLLKRAPIALVEAADAESEAAYDAVRIEAGLAQSAKDYALQDAFPHDILLDLDGGLSFRKGCYVGQEVVSRMQHRGTARRRLVKVTATTDLPATGTELFAGGKPLGTLGTVVGGKGLAIVRTDRVGDALSSDLPILAGDVAVDLALPAWTGLSFPTGAAEADA